jgi:hypothetical protein
MEFPATSRKRVIIVGGSSTGRDNRQMSKVLFNFKQAARAPTSPYFLVLNGSIHGQRQFLHRPHAMRYLPLRNQRSRRTLSI